MKIAICDDEEYYVKNIQERLEKFAEEYNEQFEIKQYLDGDKLLDEYSANRYDLIFLDIEMNGKDGLTIANEIRKMKPSCNVIFVTAHNHYYNQSFIVKAFQMLTKPLDDDFFQSELIRAIKEYQHHNKSFIFYTTKGNKVIKMRDIIYIETSYREYKLYTTKGFYYGSVKSIKDIKIELLKYNFYQIQRSYLVNLDMITEFDNYTVVMSNDDALTISRKKLKDFKEEFFKFIE